MIINFRLLKQVNMLQEIILNFFETIGMWQYYILVHDITNFLHHFTIFALVKYRVKMSEAAKQNIYMKNSTWSWKYRYTMYTQTFTKRSETYILGVFQLQNYCRWLVFHAPTCTCTWSCVVHRITNMILGADFQKQHLRSVS